MALRATSFRRALSLGDEPFDVVVLDADQRHIRRKRITLANGEDILVDFEKPVHLEQGDRLVLEDGRMAEVVAAPEILMEVVARDAGHLVELAWHIGNRHLAAQIAAERILLRRDRIIRAMLEQLGATVRDVTEPFSPEHGAYHAHDH
ncbi:urease accessory protein UreE [Aestuariivirga sp.]|jgi:urease accessory protein|uniref:urease accessory protein UreE n=1 Tax=Aestuariivirga sp. TaxID=2650926 RepID=UPI003784E53B